MLSLMAFRMLLLMAFREDNITDVVLDGVSGGQQHARMLLLMAFREDNITDVVLGGVSDVVLGGVSDHRGCCLLLLLTEVTDGEQDQGGWLEIKEDGWRTRSRRTAGEQDDQGGRLKIKEDGWRQYQGGWLENKEDGW
jgi:hypothetical protein